MRVILDAALHDSSAMRLIQRQHHQLKKLFGIVHRLSFVRGTMALGNGLQQSDGEAPAAGKKVTWHRADRDYIRSLCTYFKV